MAATMAEQDGARCGSCGYDLSGLGIEGRCPECGQTFDRISGEGLKPDARSGRSFGEGAAERHRRGDRLVRQLGALFMGALALATLACGGVIALAVEDWRYPVATAALVAGIFALAGAGWYLENDSGNS